MAQRVIASPIDGLGLDPARRTQLRGLHKIMMDSVESIPDYNADLFQDGSNLVSDKVKQATMPVYSGLSPAQRWDAISEIPNSTMNYLWDVTMKDYLYGAGVEFTFESKVWDNYGLNSELEKAKNLGIAASDREQLVGAAFWAAAFTTTMPDGTSWPDGAALFSNSHPYASSYSSTTYRDNLVSGALSLDTVIEMINLGMNWRDPWGRPFPQRMPLRLCVHPSKAADAYRIINTGLNYRSGTANNEQNPLKRYGITSDSFVYEYPYMPDANYFFMQFTGHQFYMKKTLPTRLLEPIKTTSHGVKQDIVFSLSLWCGDPGGAVGSTGS